MQFSFEILTPINPDKVRGDSDYDQHVALARTLPGLRFYYMGRVVTGLGADQGYRGELIGFDNAASAQAAADSPIGQRLAADTGARLRSITRHVTDAEEVVPMDSARPSGQPCFVQLAEFNLNADASGLAAADERYRTVHNQLTRQRQAYGLRHYFSGHIILVDGGPPDRYRTSVQIYDSKEALTVAFAAPITVEVERSRDSLMCNGRVWQVQGRVEK